MATQLSANRYALDDERLWIVVCPVTEDPRTSKRLVHPFGLWRTFDARTAAKYAQHRANQQHDTRYAVYAVTAPYFMETISPAAHWTRYLPRES